MKFTFLGTAASEGFPAVFCNCKFCQEARKLGGKNIRTRSQAIINDDLLIDFPADTYSHFLNNNIQGDKIKYLLVTHSHSDHFYPTELVMRHGAYAHDMRVPTLQMICNEGTGKKMKTIEGKHETVEYSVIKPFETMEIEGYTVTALPARHYQGDGAVFYIIKGEKAILYAHDTGYFYDEVFEYIEKSGTVFDFATFDCTNIDLTISDEGGHMGIDNIKRVYERLEKIGAVNDKTIKVINHFSHNAAPIHHKLEKRVADEGFIVSYDGLTIEI